MATCGGTSSLGLCYGDSGKDHMVLMEKSSCRLALGVLVYSCF